MFAPTFLFRNQWLRYRLVRDYPEQLKFHQSSDHKLSDLVTATDALLSEIVHDTQITTDHQIASESESYSSTGISPLRLTIGPVHTPQKRTELYHAALGIRTAISNQAVHISHPPDLHELSLENAQVYFIASGRFSCTAHTLGHLLLPGFLICRKCNSVFQKI